MDILGFWFRCLGWAFWKTERAGGAMTTASIMINWAVMFAAVGLPFSGLPEVFKWVAPVFLVFMLALVAPYHLYRSAVHAHAMDEMRLWEKNAALQQDLNLARKALEGERRAVAAAERAVLASRPAIRIQKYLDGSGRCYAVVTNNGGRCRCTAQVLQSPGPYPLESGMWADAPWGTDADKTGAVEIPRGGQEYIFLARVDRDPVVSGRTFEMPVRFARTITAPSSTGSLAVSWGGTSKPHDT